MVTRCSYRRIFCYATNLLNKKQFVRNSRTLPPNSIILSFDLGVVRTKNRLPKVQKNEDWLLLGAGCLFALPSAPFWNGFGDHSVSYPIRAVMFVPSGKDAGLWKYHFPSIHFRSKICLRLYIHFTSVYLHAVVPTHRHDLLFTFTLFFMLRTIWNLNSRNRSIFLNPTLTESSSPKIKSVRPMQRIIQKNVSKIPCPERDFNAWYRGFGSESDLRCHCY